MKATSRLPFHAFEVKAPGALARAFGLLFVVAPTPIVQLALALAFVLLLVVAS